MLTESRAITYEQWAQRGDKELLLGIQALGTDKIVVEMQGLQKRLMEMMSSALTRALIENGRRYGSIRVELEREPELKGDKYHVYLDTIQGDHPVEYVALAYNAWQEEQVKTDAWTRMPLWGYLSHWIKRTFIPSGKLENI